MRRTIPAGVGEKMQYIVHPFNDNTIRFILHYSSPINAAALRQAACALAGSVDVLHASFEAGRVRARWRVHDVRPEDCFTHLETSGAPLPSALQQALTCIRAEDRVKLRCILVSGSRESAVVLLLSHLCVDGSDGRYLLDRLCRAYDMALATGSCTGLEVKQGSRDAREVYRHLSRGDRRALLRDPRTGIRTVFPFPEEGPGRPVVLPQPIPAPVMRAAHARAREMGATLNDLLLTACYHACVKATGADPAAPVSLMSMMDLRRHFAGGDSPGLCNLTGALATALPRGLHASPADTLRDIAAQTRAAKEDPLAGLYGMPLLHAAAGRLPMGLLLAAASRLYGSMAAGLTNVGRMQSESLQLGGIAPDQAWFGGPIKKKPGLQISCMSLDDACSLAIWGHACEGDMPALRLLLALMARYVEAFAAEEE